jgi:hypothetical protein
MAPTVALYVVPLSVKLAFLQSLRYFSSLEKFDERERPPASSSVKSGRFPFSKLAEVSMSPPRVSMCLVLAKQPPPVELEPLELSTDQPDGS